MRVTMLRTVTGGQEAAGDFVLRGGRVVAEPATPGDMVLLENVLAEPIVVDHEWVYPGADPEGWLRGLSVAYRGSMLRATVARA